MATERYSYSKIDTFDQCGFKFKLKYVDKHYINSSSIALDVGTAIHKAEEAIANSIIAGEPVDYVNIKNNILIKKCELEQKFPEEYKTPDKNGRTYDEKFYEYLQTGIYRLEKYLIENPQLEIVGIEQEFEFMYGDILFHGAIDRVLRDKETGKYIIQDIKTYGAPVEDKKLVTPLQFVIYAIAVKHLYGVDEDQLSCAYDLPFCNITQEAGTKGFVQRGIKKANSLLASINNKEFKPKPSPLCHWCEFCPTNPNQVPEAKNLCPYHSYWTKEVKNFNTASEWQGLENHEAVLEHYILKATKTLRN